jgi:hypothetical protein
VAPAAFEVTVELVGAESGNSHRGQNLFESERGWPQVNQQVFWTSWFKKVRKKGVKKVRSHAGLAANPGVAAVRLGTPRAVPKKRNALRERESWIHRPNS